MVKIKIELTHQVPGGLSIATVLATEACTSEPRVVLETFDALVTRMRDHLAQAAVEQTVDARA